MPVNCVVGGCVLTSADGVSFFGFPKNPRVRRQWIRFVEFTRADFAGPRPSDYSKICSVHFESETCYESSCLMKMKLGLPCKLKLKPDAVPTIKKKKDEVLKERPSSMKRRRKDVVEDILRKDDADEEEPIPSTSASCSSSVLQTTENASTLMASFAKDFQSQQLTEKKQSVAAEKKTVAATKRLKKYKRSTRIQVCPKMVTGESQTDPFITGLEVSPIASPVSCPPPSVEETDLPGAPVTVFQPMATSSPMVSDMEADVESSPIKSDKADRTFDPMDTDPDSSSTSPDSCTSKSVGPADERKFIVFESQLLDLFRSCGACHRPSKPKVERITGTCVTITQRCKACKDNREWCSQPKIKDTAAGNLLLSAAILYSGSSVRKMLNALTFINVCTISERTFYRHQQQYLQPSILNVWKEHRQVLVDEAFECAKPLILGGDARMDSPGHTAKYGSYTLMDLERNKILDTQLVQKNMVGGSYHMELEGLKRGVAAIKADQLVIKDIVTDRHLQVAKWIREKLKDVNHFYDVWHVAKGLGKRVRALGKQKHCEVVQEWAKSINNHVYWVASSTPSGDPQEMLAKFDSLKNHLRNIHSGHSEHFSECLHGPLPEEGRKKKWLIPGTKACENLCDILDKTRLRKDIQKLSPHAQTSGLEAFHSTILHFAPKYIGYSYNGMLSRVILAVLHYNENAGRAATTDEDGKDKFALVFPRSKSGGYTVKKVLESATFGYVDELIAETIHLCSSGKKDLSDSIPELSSPPPPVCSTFNRPTKDDAVAEHKSRFPQK